MAGIGVPRPVQPKSQIQRKATANPSTEGMAASQRQGATSAATRNPSHPGKSQNHSRKKAVPTTSAARRVSQRSAPSDEDEWEFAGRSTVMDPPSLPL